MKNCYTCFYFRGDRQCFFDPRHPRVAYLSCGCDFYRKAEKQNCCICDKVEDESFRVFCGKCYEREIDLGVQLALNKVKAVMEDDYTEFLKHDYSVPWGMGYKRAYKQIMEILQEAIEGEPVPTTPIWSEW